MIKGIHKVKRRLANGKINVHYYAWRGGPKMLSEPGTPEFAAEHQKYLEALNRKSKPTDTIETLIEYFTGPEEKRNPDFLKLAETTRDDYLYAFRVITEKWPKLPIKLTQQKGMKAEIRQWHRSYSENPRKADKLLFALSKVFSYAVADELIEKNPCSGIERLYHGSRKEAVWTPAQIKKFREKASAHLLLPFEIAYLTGQRQGDILSLTWKQYDGIYLQFQQSKTKKKLKVKVHSTLKTLLDRQERDALRICLNSRRRPWTKHGFQSSWRKELAAMKITDVTFHDLRGTFITERYAEGSSVDHIAQISGHSTGEIRSVLEKHYLAHNQDVSDGVIIRMEENP